MREREFKTGNFDMLNLKVDPREEGRAIVPYDEANQKFVSEDEQVYEDQTWRVKIYSQKPFAKMARYMVMVTYKGEYLFPEYAGKNADPRHYRGELGTGEMLVNLRNYAQGGNRYSGIVVNIKQYNEILEEEYGIYDGYVFDSPNRAFVKDRFRDYNLFVVSDGEVTCTLNGRELADPTIEDLEGVCYEDSLCYEVRGATWSVVLVRNFDLEDGGPKSWLYTEVSDFQSVLDGLEQYLQKNDLMRFEDLLP